MGLQGVERLYSGSLALVRGALDREVPDAGGPVEKPGASK